MTETGAPRVNPDSFNVKWCGVDNQTLTRSTFGEARTAPVQAAHLLTKSQSAHP